MTFYIATNGEEILAIYETTSATVPWKESKNDTQICGMLDTEKWWYDEITEAEFGTFQAFGIKEIRLP